MVNLPTVVGPSMEIASVPISLFEPVAFCSLLPSYVFHLQVVIDLLLQLNNSIQIARMFFPLQVI